jgi:hypothetical protein
MTTLRVQPRQTPGERAEAAAEVEVDETLADVAAALEDWAAPRTGWTLQLRQGHDFGRANNVEAELVFAEGQQTSSVSFRLDQVDRVDETSAELVILLEEDEGIAKLVRLGVTGLAVEFFHII